MNRQAIAADSSVSPQALRAFQGCGLELEYMLVRRDSLDVLPIADRVLGHAGVAGNGELARGELGWSNELVNHLLELKNPQPSAALAPLAMSLQREVRAMNALLQSFGARLMPGGMHPWMDPRCETELWPHGNGPIYRAYDRIFDCRTHGWANLQAMHINLPFADDAEFARLHAAVRLILPLVPAIAASSPYVEGTVAPALDYRMQVYCSHTAAVPSLSGEVVPETIASRAEYEALILEPMYRAIAPHDPDGLLQYEWLNTRGAIARFDRNAIEIRVLDMQECPHADVAVAAALMDLTQLLYSGHFSALEAQQSIATATLAQIMRACIRDGELALISDAGYLRLLGIDCEQCPAGEVWSHLEEELVAASAPQCRLWHGHLSFILKRGTLATRLRRAAGANPKRAALFAAYSALCDCLDSGTGFDP